MRNFILFFLTLTTIKAIEITDYRIIYGNYDEAYINGTLKASTGNQEQTGYNLLLNANSRTIYSSAPYSIDFSTKMDIGLSQGEDKNSSKKKLYTLYNSLRYDKYLDYDNLFIYGGGDIGYRKQQESKNADDIFSKVSLGVGYGRVYDATPLAVALRIVEELKRYKVIYRDLSDINLLKLAKIIGTKENYISEYGTENFKKYWFSDMEKLIKKSHVSYQEHLGAIGILKIEEILEIEKIAGRLHGWKIRGGIGQIISNYDGDKGRNSTVDIEFSYGLPIGYEAQYTHKTLISKNLYNSQPISFSFENSMKYTYEITDIIDWEQSWDLNFERYQQGEDVLRNKFSIGFRYYLANSLTLDTTISMSKVDGTNGNFKEREDWDGDFFMGVRYRLK